LELKIIQYVLYPVLLVLLGGLGIINLHSYNLLESGLY